MYEFCIYAQSPMAGLADLADTGFSFLAGVDGSTVVIHTDSEKMKAHLHSRRPDGWKLFQFGPLDVDAPVEDDIARARAAI